MKLSILVPVYNEQATLEEIFDRVLAVQLPQPINEVEIVAVDDASSDASWQILQAYATTHPQIKLYRHDSNKGKGAAIRTAVENATGDLAIIQDADLEYDPNDYPRLLFPILEKGADVVYGSRFSSSEYRRVLMFWHQIANQCLTLCSNMLTGLNLTDMETCYKAFRLSILKSIPIRSNRFGIEPELTAKIAKRRLVIFEIPISYSGRTYNEGKKIGFKDAIQAVWIIFKFFVFDDLYKGRCGEATLRNMETATRFSKWMNGRLIPFLGETVLEVGAGIGNNVRNIMGTRRIIATEPDPEYIGMMKNAFAGRKNIQIIQWDITEKPTADIPLVDTILCSNVLEHVQDDLLALQNMSHVLKPGGRLILVVPRGKYLYGSLDTALDHFRRYDNNSLKQKLSAKNFDVECCFTMNKVSVPAWFINSRMLRRKVVGRWQLKVFDICMPLVKFLDHLLPWGGLSLICVARKR